MARSRVTRRPRSPACAASSLIKAEQRELPAASLAMRARPFQGTKGRPIHGALTSARGDIFATHNKKRPQSCEYLCRARHSEGIQNSDRCSVATGCRRDRLKELWSASRRVLRMNTIGHPQQARVKLNAWPRPWRSTSGAVLPNVTHLGSAHQWFRRLMLPFLASHCEDCGAPRGLDGRFLCESEREFPALGELPVPDRRLSR